MPLFGNSNVEDLVRKRDVKGLLKALKNSNEWRRCEAIRGLAELRVVQATQPIAEIAVSGWPNEKAEAARALSVLDDGAIAKGLITQLRDRLRHPSERADVARTLGTMGCRDAIPALRRALQYHGVTSRRFPRWMYGANLGLTLVYPDVDADLASRLRDVKSERFVQIALDALSDPCRFEPILYPLDTQALVSSHRRDVLRLQDATSRAKFVAAVEWWDKKEEFAEYAAVLRVSAAEALGELKARSSVNDLIARLDDDEEWVRHAAAQALAEIGERKAIGFIMKALHSGRLETEPYLGEWESMVGRRRFGRSREFRG